MFKKSFCLWLVSSQDGKVRKVRFSLGLVAGVATAGSIITLGILAVVGDYGRAQILRAKHFVDYQVASQQRDSLNDENQKLKSTLETIVTEKKEVENYQQTVEAKVKELQRVLESAITLSGSDKNEAKQIAENADSKSKRKRGVGGLEVACSSDAECSSAELDEHINFIQHKKLVDSLDSTLSLLRTLPISIPIKSQINSGFGVRRSPFSGHLALHKGVDFELDIGDPIRATGDGVVSKVERSGTYGLMVDVQHSKNITTRYAHLSSTPVKIGQKIKRGNVIARGGSTGRSTGPHLHYEIRINGQPKNPASFLRLASRLRSVLRG